jgi:bifunctional non-homologous end joining protein LigD
MPEPKKLPSKRVPVAASPALADLSPMLLSERTAAPRDEGDYFAEVKYDGYRVLAEFGDGRCVLKTRNGANCSTWFPEVTQSLASVTCARTVIDGEVCVLDDLGRTDFEALQARARRRRWTPGAPSVTFCAFDVLIAGERNVMNLPLRERKAVLTRIFAAPPQFVLVVGYFDVSMHPRPLTWLYEQAKSLQLEGIVGKKADSLYVPGQRSSDWFKWKRPGAIPPQRFQRR